MKTVTAVEISHNQKTGPVSATYAPIQTCPSSCPLKNRGCYAQDGNCNIHFSRISRNAKGMSIVDLARHEAEAIRALPGILPLRLHVTGDCPTNETALIVSVACAEYAIKFSQPVWAYTHSWRDVDRESWGNISVLASCETPNQVKEATVRNYRAALITPLHHIVDNAKQLFEYGIKSRICGHYARQKQCVACRMCLHKTDTCILLPTHGAKANQVDQLIDEMR